MAARTHRKGFKPLPENGWSEEWGTWEDYKERCVREGARVVGRGYNERIVWRNDTGLYHRIDGPADETRNYKEWVVNGLNHRIAGPAIVNTNGYKSWYVNGRHHRSDGPAIEHVDGTVEFYKDGIRYRTLR